LVVVGTVGVVVVGLLVVVDGGRGVDVEVVVLFFVVEVVDVPFVVVIGREFSLHLSQVFFLKLS